MAQLIELAIDSVLPFSELKLSFVMAQTKKSVIHRILISPWVIEYWSTHLPHAHELDERTFEQTGLMLQVRCPV